MLLRRGKPLNVKITKEGIWLLQQKGSVDVTYLAVSWVPQSPGAGCIPWCNTQVLTQREAA